MYIDRFLVGVSVCLESYHMLPFALRMYLCPMVVIHTCLTYTARKNESVNETHW